MIRHRSRTRSYGRHVWDHCSNIPTSSTSGGPCRDRGRARLGTVPARLDADLRRALTDRNATLRAPTGSDTAQMPSDPIARSARRRGITSRSARDRPTATTRPRPILRRTAPRKTSRLHHSADT
jgi:hypothetical protein